MATRNIVLTDHQESLIRSLIESGRFQNASEAVRAGMRLLEREELSSIDLQERLQKGVEQAKEGDLAEGSGADAVRRAFARARAGRPT